MTEDEFQKLFPVLREWIDKTFSSHANEAKMVGDLNFPRLSKYFELSTLQAAKVVRLPRVPFPPLQQWGLGNKFSAFEQGDFDGITYLDTFFIKETKSKDEALHFHELVHIVQWRELGEKDFLFRYANGLEKHGYDDSPLENMAYSMQDQFSKEQSFHAEAEIIKLLAP